VASTFPSLKCIQICSEHQNAGALEGTWSGKLADGELKGIWLMQGEYVDIHPLWNPGVVSRRNRYAVSHFMSSGKWSTLSLLVR